MTDKDMEKIAIELIRNKTEELIKIWGRPETVCKTDMGNAALIVIDVQNFTCSPNPKRSSGKERDMEEIKNIIKNINLLAERCRKKQIPVIWVRHNFTINDKTDDSGLYGRFFKGPLPETMCNLSEGTELYKDLNVDEKKDHFIFKNRYSAFIPWPSKLAGLLKKLGRNQLIIAGLASNVCVESTIRDAMQLDYEVILVSDATATVEKVMYEMTLANVKLFFGDVRKAEEILEDLM